MECTAFEGPHSLRCLQAMWLKGGCIKDGFDYPSENQLRQVELLQPLNLR